MARFLFATALLSLPLLGASPAGDLAGCKDLRTFTRLDGCTVVECGAKRRDGVKLQMSSDRQEVLEGPATSIRYSCPAPATMDSVTKGLAELAQKAVYTVIYQDSQDPNSHLMTTQHGGHWVDVDISPDDTGGGIVYTLSGVEVGPAKPIGEVCAGETAFPIAKGCVVNECTNKRRDKVEMRQTNDDQAVLMGTVHTSAISCNATVPLSWVFDSAQIALKGLGYEPVFTQRDRPEYSWLTMRSGQKWVELMSFQDGDTLGYQLTEVQADPGFPEKRPSN